MIEKRNFRTRRLLMCGLILCLIACKKEKLVSPLLDKVSKESIEQMIDDGSLLLSHEKRNNVYVFNFETGVIEIPATSLLNVEDHLDQWNTVLNFSDKQTISVPTKGNNLDFIVKEIKLNPSGYNPLAATVDVLLPGRGRVKILVKGKKGTNGTIEHLFKATNERQSIPVLGLYANYNNEVDVVFTDSKGVERGRTALNIQTEALNIDGFPTFKIGVAQQDRMEVGFNLISYPGASELDTSCPYMIDADAEVRWILLLKKSPDLARFSGSIGLKRMKNGNFLSGDQSSHRLVEMDMMGNLIKQWDLKQLGYTFHHEVTEANNGNFLITVSKSTATLANGSPRINDHIIELNPQSGTVVNEWDLAKMIQISRLDNPNGTPADAFAQTPNNWAHNNSIAEKGADLLATVRYQGIISFTHEGSLKWILSPHKNWSAAYQGFLLTPIDEQGKVVTDPKVISGEIPGNGFDWSWGPHTPVSMPNGTIMVFDNGYFRNFKQTSFGSADGYSRIVVYKVNEADKTVQQVWSYGQSRGLDGFSAALSGVQYLAKTGHVLFCPGMGVKTRNGFGGRMVEIEPATNEVIYELEVTAPSATAFHRVTRMAIYPDTF